MKELSKRRWELNMIIFGMITLLLSILYQRMGQEASSRLFIVATVLFEIEAGLRLMQRYSKVFDKPKRKRHN